jgi:hypothetical protein
LAIEKTATPIQFPSFQWHRDGFGCNDPETKGVLHPTISHLLLKLFTGHQWDPCWTLSQVAKPVLCTCSTTKGAASSLNSMPGIAQNCDSFRSGEMVATWFLRVFFLHGLVYVRKLPGYMILDNWNWGCDLFTLWSRPSHFFR